MKDLDLAPFAAGQSVEWLYEQRGGYGFRWWVPAVVLRVTTKRITIEAKLASGGARVVSVKPDRLRRPNVKEC